MAESKQVSRLTYKVGVRLEKITDEMFQVNQALAEEPTSFEANAVHRIQRVSSTLEMMQVEAGDLLDHIIELKARWRIENDKDY